MRVACVGLDAWSLREFIQARHMQLYRPQIKDCKPVRPCNHMIYFCLGGLSIYR